MRRVAVVGCGAIAEHHAEALADLGIAIAASCDREPARAERFAARFGGVVVGSVAEALARGADVVHVTTSPESHATLVRESLEGGAHVLVEKPFTTCPDDAERLAHRARELGLRLAVDHSLLFDPAVEEALAAVRRGDLGQLVGLEILRAAVAPERARPALAAQVRAGDPYRDLGSHALALAQEFLGPIERSEGAFESRGGEPRFTFDEWVTLVRCRDGLATVRISWNERPQRSELVLHGTRGGMRVDLLASARALRPALGGPKSLERGLGTLVESSTSVVTLVGTGLRAVAGEPMAYRGVRRAVASFHESLETGGRLRSSAEEAIAVVRFTEAVARAAEAEHERRLVATACSTDREEAGSTVLVTGATGGIGGALARHLVASGWHVRALTRRYESALPDGVARYVGSLEDREAVRRAVLGVDAVVHAGATMSGPWSEHLAGTVEGTRHVVDACLEAGARLVHVSSLGVLELGRASETPLDESSPVEPHPERRGSYTHAKCIAEATVRAACRDAGLSLVVLRPGLVFGGRLPLVTQAVASQVGRRWLVLGDGERPLPLVYLDDVVDGIELALHANLKSGEVVHLIDDEAPTQNEVLERALGERDHATRLPSSLVSSLVGLSELVARAGRLEPPLTHYRLRAQLERHRYTNARARDVLGWRPRIGVRTGIERTVGG